jgi:molybdopterin-guanine dinucleotide biosynthesis protein A
VRYPDVTALILCGGEGRRMGGLVKPLLRHDDDSTLLSRLEASLAGSFREILLLASEKTRSQIERHTKTKILVDREEGPAGALEGAARVVSTNWILVVGGDQLVPPASLLSRLLDARSFAHGVVIAMDGQMQPLPGVLESAAVRRAGDRSGGFGGRALRALFDAVEPLVLDGADLSEAERATFRSINTTEEAQSLGLKRPWFLG